MVRSLKLRFCGENETKICARRYPFTATPNWSIIYYGGGMVVFGQARIFIFGLSQDILVNPWAKTYFNFLDLSQMHE